MQLKIEGSIPSVNHVWRKGKNGVMYATQESKDFKNRLGWIARSNKFSLINGFVSLSIEWHCKKKGRGDLDNKFKVLQDGLKGIVYNDDSQIVEIHAKKIQNSSFDGAIIEVKEIVAK